MKENKEIVKTKLLDRVELLCKQHLSARNFFRAINEYAISTINYFVGILNYSLSELSELDADVRRILLKNNITKNAANMERLYLPRTKMGRGLTKISDKSEIMLIKLFNHLQSTEEREENLKVEKYNATLLGLIKEHIRAKRETELNETKLKEIHQTVKMDQIRGKNIHSKLFKAIHHHI